jgi:hypothetical protein
VYIIIQFVFEIGTDELYGKPGNHAPENLKIIGELTELLTENGIELPSVAGGFHYSYTHSDRCCHGVLRNRHKSRWGFLRFLLKAALVLFAVL